MTKFTNPAIVQADLTILLEVNNPLYAEARDALAAFAELVKSPEHIHTYKISPLSLWNAAAAGHSVAHVKQTLKRFSRYDLPPNVLRDIDDYMSRYGRIKIERGSAPTELLLTVDDPMLLTELIHHEQVRDFLGKPASDKSCSVNAGSRGALKQALIKIGYPAQDLAGYTPGAPLPMSMRAKTRTEEKAFAVRDYQRASADTFHASGGSSGGSGVVVLPCGAGKTIVGITVMSLVQSHTLILCPNVVAVRQWIRELLERTTLTEDQVGEYTGENKSIRPVTVATYQILTYRKKKGGEFPHFPLLNNPDWGLIVYDEVHLLPAPVFRATAELQARRRLGLTATLVREDGLETDVFTLIGPKKYDVPWKVLEGQGWIAPAECIEVRCPLPGDMRVHYAMSDDREKFRMASENIEKEALTRALLERHPNDQVLIIGQYLNQLDILAERFDIPLITGKTPTKRREELYGQFRDGKINRLIVSKVGNFAVDLPDASVMIQVSGTFGSRQEEAQRLGRVLRPKADGRGAFFYSLVTADSKDQDFAANRQLFLVEQGYRYTITTAQELAGKAPVPAEAVQT
ncbi:MAG: DEAD/DEAH box helicase [Planctomycetes bacterium]|nr:DEAD/DEAH box helicase [Planctomycetota bacterium]NUQ34817.1 DEAD/DEAH box helicase [Planctomycetaceae bacterium]